MGDEPLDSTKHRLKITSKIVQPFPLGSSKQCHSAVICTVFALLWIIRDQEMIYSIWAKVCRLFANIVHFMQETRKFMNFGIRAVREPVPSGC